MFSMNESFFADIQKNNCWFTFCIFAPLPDISPAQNIMEDKLWEDDVCVQRHIFAYIFGGFGFPIDLSKAKTFAIMKLGQIEKREPKNKDINNPEFVNWLGLFAQYNILLGTIFAYRHEYVPAAALLLNGLKTRAINIFLPYCDFIQYVLKKVEDMPVEMVEYSGVGFSVDEPMGGQELNDGNLIANVAEMVIPALEGDDGGTILAHKGIQKYGTLKRIGSTGSEKFRNRIDIYEVLVVYHCFELKKLRLYFNGYFTRENRFTIKLPSGFHLDALSEAAQIYNKL